MESNKFLDVLRIKSFRNLWLGQVISQIGDRLHYMALIAIFVSIISKDAYNAELAKLTFLTILPFFLIGPFAAPIVDRYSRKHVMIWTDIIRAVLVGLMLLTVLLNWHLNILYVLMFLVSAVTSIFGPAKTASIPNVVDKDSLMTANSLSATTGLIATLLGSAVGGALAGIKTMGPEICFGLDILTYIGSALLIATLIIPQHKPEKRKVSGSIKNVISDLKEGIRFIIKNSSVSRWVMLNAAFWMTSVSFYILFTARLLEKFAMHIDTIGYIYALVGGGMVAGAYVFGRWGRGWKPVNVVKTAVGIMSLGIFLFAYSPYLVLNIIILLALGFAGAAILISVDTRMQTLVPDELRGRVFGAKASVSNGAILVAMLAISFADKWVSNELMLLILAGINAVALTAILIYILRGTGRSEMNPAAWVINLLLYCFSRLYLRLKIRGQENIPADGQALLVANHSSYVDGIVMQASLQRPILYLMAADIIEKSYFKKLFMAMGYIPVNRNGRDLSAFRNALRSLKNGRLVGIFPEGRINCRPYPGRFKLGAVQLARNAGVPIIPIGINGAYKTYLHKKEWPLPGRIEVSIGEPIDLSEIGEDPSLDELSEFLRKKITDLIKEERIASETGVEKIQLIENELPAVNESA